MAFLFLVFHRYLKINFYFIPTEMDRTLQVVRGVHGSGKKSDIISFRRLKKSIKARKIMLNPGL
jgi:hypothetical protein